MRPISIVESNGFINFVLSLNPRYLLPARKTVTEKATRSHRRNQFQAGEDP